MPAPAGPFDGAGERFSLPDFEINVVHISSRWQDSYLLLGPPNDPRITRLVRLSDRSQAKAVGALISPHAALAARSRACACSGAAYP